MLFKAWLLRPRANSERVRGPYGDFSFRLLPTSRPSNHVKVFTESNMYCKQLLRHWNCNQLIVHWILISWPWNSLAQSVIKSLEWSISNHWKSKLLAKHCTNIDAANQSKRLGENYQIRKRNLMNLLSGLRNFRSVSNSVFYLINSFQYIENILF